MQFNTRANIPWEGELEKLTFPIKKTGSLLFCWFLNHSPFKENGNMQIDLHAANLGFVFFPPKNKTCIFMPQRPNWHPFWEWVSSSLCWFAPVCLTQSKVILRKREHEWVTQKPALCLVWNDSDSSRNSPGYSAYFSLRSQVHEIPFSCTRQPCLLPLCRKVGFRDNKTQRGFLTTFLSKYYVTQKKHLWGAVFKEM